MSTSGWELGSSLASRGLPPGDPAQKTGTAGTLCVRKGRTMGFTCMLDWVSVLDLCYVLLYYISLYNLL